MDAPTKGRRGRKKAADKIHIGRKTPLSLVDASRSTYAKERHRLFYVRGGGPIDMEADMSEEGAFIIVFGGLKDCGFLKTLTGRIDPKRIVYVPDGDCNVDEMRKAVEDLGMAFLEDQLMIFKDGCRFIYESKDIIAAYAKDIREELSSSNFCMYGCSKITSEGMYDHILNNVPSANLVVVAGDFDRSYNINWTYLTNSIEGNVPGIRVFNDIDEKIKYFDIPKTQCQSMSFQDGMSVMKAEDYRVFLNDLGMPSTYKTDKDVTIVTDKGLSMVFLTIRIFTSTILDGGTLLKIQHPRDYFVENMQTYAKNAKDIFTPYYLRLKDVALAVRRIGGAGDIVGCTVIVDDNLKIVVDPTDMQPVLYRAVTGGLIYYDSFKDSEFIDDKYALADEHLVSTLTLKKVANNVPPQLERRSIRDMNHISEALQSLISQDMVRRWDDRLLNADVPLGEVMQKCDDEEEED